MNTTGGECSLARFERSSVGNSVSEVTTLILRIPKVSASLLGSSATCSLYSYKNHLLQWRRVAHLTVLPPAPVVPKAPSPAGPGSLVGGLVSALVVIIVVVSLATGTAVILRKRQERRVHTPNSDESK